MLINRFKFATIWFLDWVVDRYIFRHRSQRFCTWVADHPWWLLEKELLLKKLREDDRPPWLAEAIRQVERSRDDR